ncbi:MAG: biotin transporter BioY [Firmicutes bacterium]|nr:biotin transporter BioY [Bacillota bacterium]
MENTNTQIQRKPALKAIDMAYIAISAALITICSWISIPVAIPFTLQTFAVCLISGLLGMKRGTITILIYILLGAIGLPVFSGFKGGIGALAGVTGGYIVGFIFTALIVGFISDRFRKKTGPLVISMIIGNVVLYAFGTAWFMFLYTQNTGSIGLTAVLMKCVIPFIIPNLIKIAVAAILVKRLERFVK